MWLVLSQQSFLQVYVHCCFKLSASVNKDDVSWCVVQPEHGHALQTLPPIPPGAKDRSRVILFLITLHHIHHKTWLLFC